MRIALVIRPGLFAVHTLYPDAARPAGTPVAERLK